MLVVLAYVPVLDAGFVWDDDDYVTRNPHLRSPAGLGRIWTDTAATPQYYPLTHTTFWIEYQLWQLEPRGYHVTNVLLHAAAVVLLWRVLILLGVPGAWLGAALFALHPVQVESVAWITERKNVLSGLFYMGAALAYLRFALGGRGRGSYGLSLALFACALLSKTVTATLPLSLALMLVWRRGRLAARDLLPLAPMLVAGASMGTLTALLERHQIGALGGEWSLSLLERVLLACRVPWFYLGKLLWPHPLTFVYPRWEVRASDVAAWLFPLAVLAAAGVLAWLWRSRGLRAPAVALIHFAIALAPASGFVNVYPMRYSWVADHFQYLAAVGPLALGSAVVVRAVQRLIGAGAVARVRIVVAASLVGCLMGLTASQVRIYRDLETLWRDTLDKNPAAWMAHNNLGALLGQRGELEQAERHLSRAVRLNPDHAGAHDNLGVVLARSGRLREAAEHFREAVRLEPEDAGKHQRLGEALFSLGELDQAANQLARAAEIASDDPQILHLLGNVELAREAWEAAAGWYRRVLAQLPDDATTHQNLGIALARAGRNGEALEHMRRSVELDPASSDKRFNLARLLARAGRIAEARSELRRVLDGEPSFEPARRALAALKEQERRGREFD